MALVEPPVALGRHPQPAHGLQGQVGGADGPGEHRGVEDPHVDTGLGQEPTGLGGLGPAQLGEVDVLPAGEQVEGVPLGLPVSQEDQLGHAPERSHPGRSGRGGHLEEIHKKPLQASYQLCYTWSGKRGVEPRKVTNTQKNPLEKEASHG